MTVGPVQLLRGYFRRRRALYATVWLTFLVGVVIGGVAVVQLGEQHGAALTARVDAVFRQNMSTTSGASGSGRSDSSGTISPVTTVLLHAATGPGGIVQTVGFVALLGLSLVGSPIVLAVVFWRGFTLGFAVTFFVEKFMLRGVLLALVTFVPHNVLAVPALIVAAASSIGFSLHALVVLFGRRGNNMHGHILRTGVMLAGSAVLLLGAALLEAYVTPTLMDTAASWLLRE